MLYKSYDSPSSTLLLLDTFFLIGFSKPSARFLWYILHLPLSNTAFWFATLTFRMIFSNPLICNLHSVQCRKHVSLLSPLMTFQLMQFCMGKYAFKCFLLFQTEYCRESIHKIKEFYAILIQYATWVRYTFSHCSYIKCCLSNFVMAFLESM